MPAGRPVSVWTQKRLEEVNEMMEEYIVGNTIPILAEFCYQNDLDRTEMYKHPELSHTIKKMMLKKESNLEKAGLSGSAPVAMCAFSLKQLGWRDRVEVDSNEALEKLDKIISGIDEQMKQ